MNFGTLQRDQHVNKIDPQTYKVARAGRMLKAAIPLLWFISWGSSSWTLAGLTWLSPSRGLCLQGG